MHKNLYDRPLAAQGLISYRAKGRYGHVMIGAKNDNDAWSEASRSTDRPTKLEVWNGEAYIPVEQGHTGVLNVNQSKEMKARISDIVKGKVCPYCGKKPVLENSSVVYGKDYGPIYLCRPCRAWVGVHKGTVKPMGRLANEELRYWKKEAHAAFDPIWQAKVNLGWGKFKARNSTYEWLAKEMKLSLEYTHIGMFDVNQCKKVIELCKKETMPRKKITPVVKKEDPKQLGKIGVIQEILKLVEAHNGVVNAILNDYLVTDGAELEIGAAGNNLWKDVEQLVFTDNPEEDFEALFNKLKNIENDLGTVQLEELSTLFTDSEVIEFVEGQAGSKGYALIKVETMDQQEKLRQFAETELWPAYNQQRENILI